MLHNQLWQWVEEGCYVTNHGSGWRKDDVNQSERFVAVVCSGPRYPSRAKLSSQVDYKSRFALRPEDPAERERERERK